MRRSVPRGVFRLFPAVVQGTPLQGIGDMVRNLYGISSGKVRERHIQPLRYVGGKDTVKGFFGHAKGLFMGKPAGHDIGHIRELRDVFLAFFFDNAMVVHLFLPYARLGEQAFGERAQIPVAVLGNGHATHPGLDEDVVRSVYAVKIPAVLFQYIHDLPRVHEGIMRHTPCTIKPLAIAF